MQRSYTSGCKPSRARGLVPGGSRPRLRFEGLVFVMALGALAGCGGGGGGSAESPLQTGTVSAPPEAVTGLVATVGNSPTVTLSWNPSTGAEGYVVYWSDKPGVSAATGTAIREVQAPFVHEGLTAGKQYHYVVIAVNAAGESGLSSEISALLPPAAPTAVTALSGDSRITVSWQDAPHAERYRVYWGTQAGVGKTSGQVVDGVTSPWVHANLQNGTPYYYVVTAVGAGGEGPVSQQVSATPSVPIPGAPLDLTAQATPGTARSITLAWLAPGLPVNAQDIQAYRLYRSVEPGIAANPSGATVTELGSTTGFVDAVPIAGITYYYAVTAVTAAGESPWSVEVSATATDDGDGGSGSGDGSGSGGGGFDCGEPVLCWSDENLR